MKKSSFRSYALVAAACLMSASAWATGPAQVVTSSLYNSGSIANTVKTNASVTGAPGSSYSAATGEAYSTTKGSAMTQANPVCACGAISGAVGVTGDATSGVSGTAFNVSTGPGATGTASSVGTANSVLDAKAAYTGPGQNVNVYGDINQSAAMSVIAAKNTGGSAASGNTGSFAVDGTVGSSYCTSTGACGNQVINKTVWGSVEDVKASTSFANTGGMTVDGVLLNPGVTNASASTTVNAGGKYLDPQ